MKRVLLVCDAFPPIRNSAAVHMRDLASFLESQSVYPIVMTCDESLRERVSLEQRPGLTVLRVKPAHLFGGRLGRLLRELSYSLWFTVAYFRFHRQLGVIDGIVWYSPSIFFSPFIFAAKIHQGCKAYLILRDVFPDWAIDLGIIKSKIVIAVLRRLRDLQFTVANRVGLNAPGNLSLLVDQGVSAENLEVLWTWLPESEGTEGLGSSDVDSIKPSSGDVHLIYAGNLGVAQKLDFFIDNAKLIWDTCNATITFIGGGEEKEELVARAHALKLTNVFFHEEVSPRVLDALLCDFDIGLVCLDVRHKTHNVPGKLMHCLSRGLPVLVRCNPNNDIISLIESHGVGVCFGEESTEVLQVALNKMGDLVDDSDVSRRCKNLALEKFSIERAWNQISNGLFDDDTELLRDRL